MLLKLMKIHTPAAILLGLTAFTLGPASAYAEEEESYARPTETSMGSGRWTLGLGAITAQSPYEGIDSKTLGVPLISYNNQYVRVQGTSIDLKLPSASPVEYSLRAKVALNEGYKASDSSAFTGMADRNGGMYLGAGATWNSAIVKVSAELLKDYSGNSGGSEFKLGIDHAFSFAKQFQITPHVSVTALDSQYVDYYYGVAASEATPTRAQYTGSASLNTEVGLRIGYSFDARQHIIADLSQTRWGTGITDSPLVTKSSATSIMVGYAYSF